MLAFKLYMTFLFALLGAVMGSFLNCWAQRYAQGERYPRGRSRCPSCGHTLGALELVPILSFLILRGRCKSCHEKISPRYPVTEALGAVLFASVYLRFDLTLYTAELVILFTVLMLLSFIDYGTMLLPNGPMLAALVSWAAFLPAHEDWKSRAVQGLVTALAVGAAILAISLLMDKLLKRDTLGGGDIKLFALLALYLGPWSTLLMVIVSCIVGLLFAALTKRGQKPFPFGPSIASAAALTLLWGGPVIQRYLGLF